MALKLSSPLVRFGVVPTAVAVALLLRWPLWPVLGGEMPLLLLWPAVGFCAWLGGLWPGLAATALSALAGGIFIWLTRDPVDIYPPAVWVGLLAFVALGGLGSLGLERLHETNRELQEHARRLDAERLWLRVITTSIGEAVIVTDSEERVTLLNNLACALTGWSREQALGEHVNKVFHLMSEKTRQTIEKPVARVMRDGKAAGPGSPNILVARDGIEKRVEECISPLRNSDGVIAGAVISFQDVSQRRTPIRDSAPGTARVFEPAALSQVPTEASPMAIRLRIMVVEDNAESAEGLATLLRLQGHDVAIAYDGLEAVKKAGQWLPQVVLCDIRLPGLDGLGVAAAIRKSPATARARLIAISGTSSDEEHRRSLQAGFHHHLTKPIDPQVLQTVIALQTLLANNESLTGRGQSTA
jgi:PAS domain S-box-containing protein